jgi:hypothetical protein
MVAWFPIVGAPGWVLSFFSAAWRLQAAGKDKKWSERDERRVNLSDKIGKVLNKIGILFLLW